MHIASMLNALAFAFEVLVPFSCRGKPTAASCKVCKPLRKSPLALSAMRHHLTRQLDATLGAGLLQGLVHVCLGDWVEADVGSASSVYSCKELLQPH